MRFFFSSDGHLFILLQGINGILADEMGLGKTVQSIALLAHLAEVRGREAWGVLFVHELKKKKLSRSSTFFFLLLLTNENIQHLHPFASQTSACGFHQMTHDFLHCFKQARNDNISAP